MLSLAALRPAMRGPDLGWRQMPRRFAAVPAKLGGCRRGRRRRRARRGPDDGGDLGGADGQQVALLDGCLGAGGQGVLLRSDDFVEDLVGDGRLVGAEAVEGGLVLGDRALVQGEQPAQQWFVGC